MCDASSVQIASSFDLRSLHVADHRHAARPLRHSAEISVAELRHAAAARAESVQDGTHGFRRDGVPDRKMRDQSLIVGGHVFDPSSIDCFRRISSVAWSLAPQ
jgi:hypothetical protein